MKEFINDESWEDVVVSNKTTIHIARVSVAFSLEDYTRKIEERVKAINAVLLKFFEKPGKLVDNPSIDWIFGDVETDGDFVFGKMGKIRKERLKTIFNEKTRKFIKTKAQDDNAVCCSFVFSLSRHILVFEERKPHLGYKEFIEIFTSGYDRFVKQRNAMTITLLASREEAEHIINSQKVISVDFHLRPSNPDMGEDNRIVDEELKAMRADMADYRVKGKNGLDFTNKRLKASKAQADRGYGDYKLRYAGKEQGQVLTFSSKNKTLKETITRPKEESELKNKLKEQLHRALRILDGKK